VVLFSGVVLALFAEVVLQKAAGRLLVWLGTTQPPTQRRSSLFSCCTKQCATTSARTTKCNSRISACHGRDLILACPSRLSSFLAELRTSRSD
jgi:hypothetical protein